ncbi:MAG: SCO family protein [Alphaproteobacteria bacterium]|nr:SCO family protein [Alphaproteobacteria bacterium]
MRWTAALWLVLAAAVAPAATASAGLSRADLARVSASPPAGARLDLALELRDTNGATRSIAALLDGRTGFVTFVDYTCNTLCGTDLMLLSQALQKAHAEDYRILVVGIDPKDDAQAALAMARKEMPAALRRDTVLLLPDKAALASLTGALGFRYTYDAAIDQFAHPAVVYVVSPEGRVRATLSPFALTTADMAAVLRDPPQGLWQHVRLLCYAFDPTTGLYTLRIVQVLRGAGVLTLLALATALLVWNRRRAA